MREKIQYGTPQWTSVPAHLSDGCIASCRLWFHFQIVYHSCNRALSTVQQLNQLLLKKRPRHQNNSEETVSPKFLKGGVLSPAWYLPKQFSKIWPCVISVLCAYFGHDPNVRCVSWKLRHYQLHRYHCFIFLLVEGDYLYFSIICLANDLWQYFSDCSPGACLRIILNAGFEWSFQAHFWSSISGEP